MANFLIYKSSAGSGKTYTLVKEYLKIVLRNPDDFRHTLAITFTNKAAEEMKSRIMQKLGELSEGKDTDLLKTLINEGVTGDIPAQAKKVLELILHKYSYFSILTIDSFFHRVIRSFAKELKLHLAYNIEMDNNKVMSKIVDDLLAEIGTNRELTSYLEEFALSRVEDSKDWKIEKEISRIGSEIFKERFFEKKSRLKTDITENRESMKVFIDTIFKITKSFESEMKSYAVNANEIMEKLGLDMKDFPYGKGGYINYLLNKIHNGDYEPTARVYDVYNNPAKWFIKSTPANARKAVASGIKELMEKAVECYENKHVSYYTAKELAKSIYVIGIFKDLLEKLKNYRDENRLMLISDTNNILQQVIAGESSPFVYEKIGNTYKYYLIDEFQDTSTCQWQNLLPLIINSLSENYFSMVVGDVKQSIYRWRNGNMKLLLEEIYKHLHNYSEVIEDKNLDENYRSKQEIVEFNNRFFTKASEKLASIKENDFSYLITNAYKDVNQKCSGGNGGYVNLVFIRRNKDDELSTKEKAGLNVISTVKSVQDDGFSLKDILILVRKNTEGSEIASLLMNYGYKVISNESLMLINSPKVKLLINLLKYIVDHKNILAKTEALYNLINVNGNEIPPDKVFTDHKNGKDSLFNSLMPKDFFKTDETSGKIEYNKINPELNNLTLYELIEKLIRVFNLNKTGDSYLLRFQDMILEYIGDNNPDITSFLAWWELNKLNYSIIVPVHEDAIRVMTIHRAKGLQSPIVIIPYANWNLDIEATKDLIWVSNEEAEPFNQSVYPVKAVSNLAKSHFALDYEEEFALTNLDNLNLLYVAFTRPIERLYVIIPEKGDYKYNAGKMTDEIISSDEVFNKNYTVIDDAFEAGVKAPHKKKEENDLIISEKLIEYVSTDWFSKIVILPKHRSTGLFVSAEHFDCDKSNGKTKRGLMMHEILSNIKTAMDVDSAIETAQNKGILAETEKEPVRKEINKIINLEEIKDWFSGKWEIKTESDILLPNGKSIRPDRVMVKDGMAILVDYKTGKKSDTHISQLNNYAEVLKQAGYKQVEKYILYLDETEIVKI
jgi:ATP-dependent exoDNAse (exonuclease V) beta subunit